MKTMSSNTSRTFLKGAAILSASMLVVKIMGMVYKVAITNLYSCLGDQYAALGSGIFSNAYEMYIPLFTLATAGFPIAVSRLISESVTQGRYKDVRRIHKLSIPFFVIIGLLCFSIMFFGSFLYINVIHSPYSLIPMLILAPTIFFGCLESIYRGYFEGMRNMTPTAISEIIEAAGKMVLGLIIAYVVMQMGLSEYKTSQTIFGIAFGGDEAGAMNTLLSFSVAGAIAGIVLGSFAAFLFLFLRYKIGGDGIPKEYYENSIDARRKKEIFSMLMKTAIPIGLGAFVMSISTWIDSMVIQNVLQNMAVTNGDALLENYAGLSGIKEAIYPETGEVTIHTVLWGAYGAALTLMQVVTAVTQVFGTSAMPNVTSAYTRGNKQELKSSMETILRLTMMVAFPAGLGLSVLAKPILSLIYTDPTLIEISARVLTVMGFTTIVTSAITPICSMLQGIGKINIPLFLYVGGLSFKVFITWSFVSIVEINIQGATAGSLVAYTVMCVVALYLLIKYSGVMPDLLSTIVKPLGAALCCAAAAYFSHMFLEGVMNGKLATIAAIGIAVVVYLLALLILRTFTANEIKFLPKGEKIAKVLEKLHLIG